MKTNKAFAKRIKISGRGKLLVRSGGQNHFLAKDRRVKQLGTKKHAVLRIKRKNAGRFLPFK